MSEQNIKCPHCEKEFSLDETLSSRIEAGVKAEKVRARAELDRALRKKESEYGAREAEREKRIEARIDADRVRIKAAAEESAKERSFVEMRALREEKEEQARSIAALRSAELWEILIHTKDAAAQKRFPLYYNYISACLGCLNSGCKAANASSYNKQWFFCLHIDPRVKYYLNVV